MATIFATKGVLRRSDNTKIVFCRGSAPDPAGGAYDAPPDPLVGWGGGYPFPFPIPSTPSASRPPKLKVWLRPWVRVKQTGVKLATSYARDRRPGN